ncbi:ave [Bugula neritina]|uniref:Ave n=1 Tax=Bugula neritina TaxID=10212 RepID=A0A7J7J5S0_BUGNE|nr:ave [Bugula neritina]
MDSNQKRKSKLKPLHLWSVDDVLHWLRKHIGEGYYIAYGNTFKEHAITGRTLKRLNESGLIRMGMKNRQHRVDLLAKISVLKIKSDVVELQSVVPTSSSTST